MKYLRKLGLILAILTVLPAIIFVTIQYIKYKKIKNKKENHIDTNKKLPFKINILEQCLGGNENIVDISSTLSKVSFELKDASIVNIEELKKITKTTRIMKSNNKISIIFGDISKTIEEIIKRSRL